MHIDNQDLNNHSLKLWVIWAIAIILHLLSSLLTFHILIRLSDPTMPIRNKLCRIYVFAVLYKKFLPSLIFTNLCSMFLSIVLAVLQSSSYDNPLVIFKIFVFLIQHIHGCWENRVSDLLKILKSSPLKLNKFR